jgi:Putative abortive phage resistance protein AbiGi, antitoxin
MSEYVVHFTKAYENRTAYDNMMSICWERRLRAKNRFGIARKIAPEWPPQNVVCFSDIPLHLMSRLAKKRGDYAIGFKKEAILKQGGGPMWYVEKDTTTAQQIRALIDRATESTSQVPDPIWFLTPFIDVTGNYPTGTYRFEWEREWRKREDFIFDTDDVAFLVLPEHLHSAARAFFTEHERENTGPAYLCPYLDANWNRARVSAALAAMDVKDVNEVNFL